MQDFINKKILLGVCGGIAAYKSAYLVRELTRLGAQVKVIMTQSAQQFITPLTFQALSGNEVRCDLFDAQAERGMSHIDLARWADYVVIAPTTANFLAKMANGIADDLLSTVYLVTNVPILVCPAMNHSMWAHPATQNNYHLLKERGVFMIGPEEGSQACGEHGLGRVSESEQIINALRLLEVNNLLAGKKILITAGPTRELIDPVRYLSNLSSGKMGYALAEAAAMAGAKVTLVSGPCHLNASAPIELIQVETAREMHAAVMENLESNCIFIGAAAVADYRIENPTVDKMKKLDENGLYLKLVQTTDILQDVAKSGKTLYCVGFAAETSNLVPYALAKLAKKNVDMMIANEVGKGIGFEASVNKVTIITKETQIELPLIHKTRLAAQIIAILAGNLQNASA